MQVDDPPHDRQSEAGAGQRDIATRRRTPALEALKNVRQIILCNAASGVGDGQLDRIGFGVRAHLRRVPYRRPK